MIELEYWTASWCGPCRSMAPIIEELKAAGVKINKIDSDENQTLSRQLGIQGIPTFIIKRNGREVNRIVGARNKAFLEARLREAESL